MASPDGGTLVSWGSGCPDAADPQLISMAEICWSLVRRSCSDSRRVINDRVGAIVVVVVLLSAGAWRWAKGCICRRGCFFHESRARRVCGVEMSRLKCVAAYLRHPSLALLGVRVRLGQ